MAAHRQSDIPAILGRFRLFGTLQSVAPYGAGHINDTYASVYDQAGTRVRYIHQRVNGSVFRRPDQLMENVDRVTRHQAGKYRDRSDASRSHLVLVPSDDDRSFVVDGDGAYWRTYLFVEGARTYNVVESESQAEAAAAAFARFLRDLSDLGGSPLYETIPDFHHSPKRFDALQDAVNRDPKNRAVAASEEISFVERRRQELGLLLEMGRRGELPLRVTHNDTKLNNVMIDDETGKGVCVIDLDTVMPGFVHYDFGDLVRTSTSPAAEDERDLGKVTMRLPMFEALVRGYLSQAGDVLTDTELEYLPFAGRLMTMTIGVRFLTDFLEGDVYFKTARPEHNLDRCRTQFALVASMETQKDAMEEVVLRESGRRIDRS